MFSHYRVCENIRILFWKVICFLFSVMIEEYELLFTISGFNSIQIKRQKYILINIMVGECMECMKLMC